jgi:YidC/Oxa1 family membrane protein insertase
MTALFNFFHRIFTEVISVYVFFRRIEKRQKEILFYSEDNASWNSFEGLVEYLTGKLRLDVCYITSSFNDPRLTEKRACFTALYINKLLPFLFPAIDSKLILMTMPDLHQFHVRRSERGATHVYLFHNIGSSFPVIRFGALFHYDTVFLSGPHHREEIAKQEELYGLRKKRLVEFGYYKLERVYEDYKAYTGTHGRAERREGMKARVLVAPSWGEHSILNVCGKELIRVLLDGGYEVITRPHPMTLRKSPEVIEDINSAFGGRTGYTFERDISSSKSFYESDILISDWSGVSYEYAFGTERPVLFIDVPMKIMNPRYAEIGIEPVDRGLREKLGKVVQPDALGQVCDTIDELLSEKDRYVQSIRAAREKHVFNFGSSSEAGGEFIGAFLGK